MTISLTHLTDLQRVRVDVSARPDGTLLVERSLNELLWTTVRGGVALPVDAGTAQLDDYEWPDSTLTHYRVSPVDPPAGLLLDGTVGNFASTPDAAVLDINGDLVLAAEVSLADWTPASTEAFVNKYAGAGQRSYRLVLNTAGVLQLNWSTDGTAVSTEVSSVAPTPDADGLLAVRARLEVDAGGSGNYAVTFWTAPDIDGPWTTLGTQRVGVGTTSIHAGTEELRVGADGAGTSINGTVHAALVIDGNVTGTVVADPDFAAQPHGTTGFADSAGRTWTVQGDALVNGQETASITPSLAGRVWLKSIRHPFLNQLVTVSQHGDIEHSAHSAAFAVKGRSLPSAVTDLHGGRDHVLDLHTRNDSDERRLELSLRAGEVFFLHVPIESVQGLEGNVLLPGSMHVLVGQWAKHRVGGVSEVVRFSLPMTEVNPPAADVVGGTLTWGGVLNLYGSWEALVAVHPSWLDLLQTVGSPEDLVTL